MSIALADAVAAAARLLLYLGATLVIGWVALDRVVNRLTPAPTPLDGHAATTLSHRWGPAALLTGILLLLVGQRLALDLPWGESIPLLAETAWGRGWILLVSAALVAVVGLHVRQTPWIAAIGAVALAAQMGALGHSGADTSWPIISRLLDAVHVLAISSWLGALALLQSADRPFSRWSAYSRVATIAAPLAVLSGAGLSWRRLVEASLSDIATSTYGQLLAAKVALAVVILVYGARHRRQVHADSTPTRRDVRREVLVALAVLVVTAVLTGTEPPY